MMAWDACQFSQAHSVARAEDPQIAVPPLPSPDWFALDGVS